MPIRVRPPLLAFALAAACAASPAFATRTLGALTFEPCSLSPDGLALTVAAQCTKLAVAEDRSKPDGRTIELAIAWIPNDDAEPAADPVFFLAGGPGQAALESYPLLHAAFAEVRRRRHIVLVDQRGTGGSNRLACKDERGDNAFAGDDPLDVAASVEFVRRCAAELGDAVRHYTTTDAVEDLEAVRAAIGADEIDLVGVSYGTRVAQQYAKRHPEHTRAIVLDGVVPNTLVLGAEHAMNLEAALDAHFARCAKAPACAERFGSPRANLDALLAEARSAPRTVAYRDPQSNAPREDRFDAATLASVVRLYAYQPTTAALLPLSLHEAAQGRPESLLAQARMLTSLVGESIMHGMQLSVICAEDAPELAARAEDADTTLGTVLVEHLLAQCEAWPRGRRADDFREPLTGEVPVLLLSGELDPVTPPRYGEEVAKSLANARHLVLAGQGHNVLGQGCAPKLVARFLEQKGAATLDVACLEDLGDTPPFAGYYGWEP